jgi:hypothetical protein
LWDFSKPSLKSELPGLENYYGEMIPHFPKQHLCYGLPTNFNCITKLPGILFRGIGPRIAEFNVLKRAPRDIIPKDIEVLISSHTPIPIQCQKYYFEVIIEKGEPRNPRISVGLNTRQSINWLENSIRLFFFLFYFVLFFILYFYDCFIYFLFFFLYFLF